MGQRTIAEGLAFTEGPRWHEGRLWCSDMHAHRVLSCTPDGDLRTEVEMPDDEPSGLGWLPDGRLLVVAMESQQVRRLDDRLVVHADLSSIARGSLNDMIVAGDGTAYVGDMGSFIHDPDSERHAGQTIAVRPDGTWWCAADDLASPNGHILTDDDHTLLVAESAGGVITAFDRADDGTLHARRVYAELVPAEGSRLPFAPPDGICLDAEGAVWVADPVNHRVLRARPGRETAEEIDFGDLVPVACVLGGDDRRTLFVCAAADWKREVVRAAPTGVLIAIDVDVPGVGRP